MNMRRTMLGGLGAAVLAPPLVMHAIDPKAEPLPPGSPAISPPRRVRADLLSKQYFHHP